MMLTQGIYVCVNEKVKYVLKGHYVPAQLAIWQLSTSLPKFSQCCGIWPANKNLTCGCQHL